MKSFGKIVEDILYSVRKGSESRRDDVKRWVNEAYFDIAQEHPWLPLRKEVDLDFSDMSDETGLFLPANLVGVRRVREVLSSGEIGHDYISRDKSDIDPYEVGYRYVTYTPSGEALASGTDLSVDTGDDGTTTLSSAAVTSAHAGEYVRFGEEPGMYLLSDETTFSPTYHGPAFDSEGYVEVRPPTARKLICYNEYEEVLSSNSVKVYYWELPTPMYRDTDVPVIDDTPIERLALIKAIGMIHKRQSAADRYRGEYREALEEAKHRNPDCARTPSPRDRRNRAIDLDPNLFSRRGAGVSRANLRDILRRGN